MQSNEIKRGKKENRNLQLVEIKKKKTYNLLITSHKRGGGIVTYSVNLWCFLFWQKMCILFTKNVILCLVGSVLAY